MRLTTAKKFLISNRPILSGSLGISTLRWLALGAVRFMGVFVKFFLSLSLVFVFSGCAVGRVVTDASFDDEGDLVVKNCMLAPGAFHLELSDCQSKVVKSKKR
jgi:hypothetical protein